MRKKTKKPELRIHRAFTNERPMLELFADAYRVYFAEKKRMKSSGHTFDLGKAADYNDDTDENKEENDDGSAA